MKKLIAVITALMLALSAFPAFAAEADDTDGGDRFTVSYIATVDESTADEAEYQTTEPEPTTEPSEEDPWWNYDTTPDEPGYDPGCEGEPGCADPDPGSPGDDDPWWEWEPTTEAYEDPPVYTEPCTEQPTREPNTEAPEVTEAPTYVHTVAPTYAPTAAPTYAPKTDPPEQQVTQSPTFAPTNILPPINKDTSTPRFDLITGTMRAGKTLLLTVRNSGGKKIKFSSSNKKVAKINSKGLVTTLKKGFVRITAKVGSKYCYFTLKVISNPTLSKKSIKVKKGKTKKVLIYDKAPSVNLKFKNKKKAKIVSKNNVNYIKVLGRKRGKTTLQVRVNGKWLKLGVKII